MGIRRVSHASSHVARNGPIRRTCAKAFVSPCVKSSDWLLSASHLMLSCYRSSPYVEDWLPDSRKCWGASKGLTVARRRSEDANMRLLSNSSKTCRLRWQFGLKQFAAISCFCLLLLSSIDFEVNMRMRIIYTMAAQGEISWRVSHASSHVARNGPIRQTCAKAFVSPCVKSSDWLLSASHLMLSCYRSSPCEPLEWSLRNSNQWQYAIIYI